MFQPVARRTKTSSGFAMLELVFHAAVRNVRKSHGNAIWGLVLSIIQALMMVLVFLVMMSLLGMRSSAIRGDFLLYIMSGVFMYMTHSKTLQAVAKCDGPTSSMMKHAPMNVIIAVAAAALAALYQQVLAAAVILYFYHVVITPITIDDPVGTMAMFLLSWASGIGVGMIFKSATPWSPDFFGLLVTIYARANMIASGKMFVANMMPTSTLKMFDWNPLFHTIDQARGFVFLNYNPHYSSISYPLKVTLVLMLLGLMGESYTRKYASVSWGARG